MTSDLVMTRIVRRGFATRLPLALISLVLEFANFENAERKLQCVEEVNRVCVAWEDWVSGVSRRKNYRITNIDGPFLNYCLREGYHNEASDNGVFKWAGERLDLDYHSDDEDEWSS